MRRSAIGPRPIHAFRHCRRHRPRHKLYPIRSLLDVIHLAGASPAFFLTFATAAATRFEAPTRSRGYVRQAHRGYASRIEPRAAPSMTFYTLADCADVLSCQVASTGYQESL